MFFSGAIHKERQPVMPLVFESIRVNGGLFHPSLHKEHADFCIGTGCKSCAADLSNMNIVPRNTGLFFLSQSFVLHTVFPPSRDLLEKYFAS